MEILQRNGVYFGDFGHSCRNKVTNGINLLTSYKREKQREVSSKTSGSGTSEVYVSNWDYYDAMTFTDDTHEMDESINSISPVVPEKKKKHNEKTSSRDEELSAKSELWKTLANTMAKQNVGETSKQPNGYTLEDKARRFGQSVADGVKSSVKLMTCFVIIKKQEMLSRCTNHHPKICTNHHHKTHSILYATAYLYRDS